jgi:hypothetical protein
MGNCARKAEIYAQGPDQGNSNEWIPQRRRLGKDRQDNAYGGADGATAKIKNKQPTMKGHGALQLKG